MPRDPVVVLAQDNAPRLSRLYQTLPGTIIQPRVGWETNVLLLHRGIHIDTGKLGGLHRLELQTRFDRFFQQLFRTGFSNTIAPPGHA